MTFIAIRHSASDAPMTYLANVLERVVSDRTKQNESHTLLPWN
jgi:hypothetical protein